MSDIRGGIVATANALGISPRDLATAISYETAGTFDPAKRGPTTQWGQHRGLIQFGEPQAKKYGVDWDDPLGSQLGPDGAVANYLRDTGVKPGMGLLDIYSAINAGGVGRYNASDANNGGAPGTVADKVTQQMVGHRSNADRLLGGLASRIASQQPSGPIASGEPAPQLGTTVLDKPAPPVFGQMAASLMGEPQSGHSRTLDLLSAMASMAQQSEPEPMQLAPMQGPTQAQATALSSLVQSLLKRNRA